MTPRAADLDAPDSAAARFRLFAAESNALHARYLTDSALLRNYQTFVSWQTGYMSGFYKDLRQRPGYAAALDFVITDLTGISISQRDEDLERALPVMVRMLPEKALQTLAAAMELNARVLATNLAVCQRLSAAGPAISEAQFCAAYRDAASLGDCLEMADLTRKLGQSLNRIIRIRALGFMLKTMHGPAHLAGFGALHDFLQTGYERFQAIDDVAEFLERMHGRMIEVLTRIFEEPMNALSREPMTAVELP